MEHQPFSVAMCVYGKDNPNWFDRAIKSVTTEQTLKPNELVLIVDGPIPEEIEKIISKHKTILANINIAFKLERFEVNQGHGNARRKSVELCSNELIALMDADDISLPDRFESQLNLYDVSKADVVGGNISEFIGEESNVISYRIVPEKDADIKKVAKSRCPMNQVSVMFKKSSYDVVGGYIDWFWEEDYYLWLRMILQNMVFANSSSIFVNVRVGEEMYKRRGGLKYYRSEKRLQKFMLGEKMISLPKYVINCGKRFIVQVLMPSKIRGWLYKKLARSKR
ncbi:MAG: UDP-Gal:alpha-D-GlcNAc-diphosphoundecaprenol beta-1,3-galactosyltransferase [Tenericutes bacterium ADurb.BinA124]|nr:MAG: UDP-Gal:alpha-D-GlcNAc-diphosphoundecaprenol beta-1,3-galactosyltransferase [Tenericutes bacterium ADurb.BinA124]